MRFKLIFLFLVSCAFLLQGRELFPEKAFWLAFNFAKTQELHKIGKLADRARKCGYNTVYLADAKFGNPWSRGSQYEKNLKAGMKMLRDRGLKVAVYVCAHGQFLAEVPFEAECVPVDAQEYRIVKGRFTGENLLSNSSFEDGLKGWLPDAGRPITIDSKVSASGKKSLHFRLDPKKRGQIRVKRIIKTRPFQHYRLSLKLKTRGVRGKSPNLGFSALPVAIVKDKQGKDEFRYISHHRIDAVKPIKPTQDWQEYTMTFNTLDESRITLFMGNWGAPEGEFWIDDVELRAASFINIMRRPDMPLTVTSADGKIRYREGKDFSVVRDPVCGNYRWKGRFEFTHKGPEVTLLPGSAIKEGATVKVSYHHVLEGASQAPDICLNSPLLKKLVARQIRWFKEKIDPDGYLIAIDEYRCYGYDPNCLKSGKKSGDALKELAVFTCNEIKKTAPGKKIYMWHDMFDPYGNCKKEEFYYSVKGRGSLWNSWKGLPRDIIILRWQCKNLETVKNSMKHWGALGMKYIQFPTYFTSGFSSLAKPIMEVSAKDPNCIGIGFAQWGSINNYKPHFEKMLEIVRDIGKAQKKSK